MKRTKTHKIVWLKNDTHEELRLFRICIEARSLDKAIQFMIEKVKKLNINGELNGALAPDALEKKK